MNGCFGIYKGVCANNDDPEGLFRVRAIVPQVFGDPSVQTDWAWPCFSPADVSDLVLPNPTEPVWLMFEGGDTDYPVWLGTWLTVAAASAISPPSPITDVGYIPGVKAGDSTSGTDYGLIINEYMATIVAGDTPLLVPPGPVYVMTPVIPPQGVFLKMAGMSQGVSTPLSGTVLLPNPNSPPSSLVVLANNGSGLKNGNVNAGTTSETAIMVQGNDCINTSIGAFGGTVCTVDSESAKRALWTIFRISGQASYQTTTALALRVNGSDWTMSAGRIVNGTKALNSGGIYNGIHFTEGSGGLADTSNVQDGGGNQFNGCYFDSLYTTVSANALIDRSGASGHAMSNFVNCKYYQNDSGQTGFPVILETTVATAGANVSGGVLTIGGAGSSFTNFIQGAVSSTTCVGVEAAGSSLSSTFTDVVPPSGTFAANSIGGTPVGPDGQVYNCQAYGVLPSNADNASAWNTFYNSVPLGSVIWVPDGVYFFSSITPHTRAVTIWGNWNRYTSSSALYGSIFAPTTSAALLGMQAFFEYQTGGSEVIGICFSGTAVATEETNGTVTINGTTVQLSTLAATTDMVGALIAGPSIPADVTVASVNTGANTITLSAAALGVLITGITSGASNFTVSFAGFHNLSVGGTITLSGFTPSAYNSTWTVASKTWNSVTVTSALNPGTASVIGTYTAPLTAATIYFGGHGVQFGGASSPDAHDSIMRRCFVQGFNQGIVFGEDAEHVTVYDTIVGGNYDGVLFDTNNAFDFAFYNCNLVGNTRSSARLAANTAVENVLFSRTHMGFSQVGMMQDVTTNGDGWVGIKMEASPIEFVSVAHIAITNGGSWEIDPACYWTWSNGTPANPAFSICGQQNGGNITFSANLLGWTNANCPYVYFAGSQSNGSQFLPLNQLGTFAALWYPFVSYNALSVPGSAYLFGALVETGNTTNFISTFETTLNGLLVLHSVSKTANYSTIINDLWTRCTANSFTVTLTQFALEQILIVTNEGSGTITIVAGTGSYTGPATLPPGGGAIIMSDGTNWHCVSSYLPASPWIAVVGGVGFKNSWANFGNGYASPSFRLTPDGKTVQLGGFMSGGTTPGTAFTLPAGYHPITNKDLDGGNVQVDTSGNVKPQTAAGGDIDGLSFPLDL
jgi:hypothetical protein